MEFGRVQSLPNWFRYTFEDKLEEEIPSAKHASQTSKMESRRDPSPPNGFWYTCEGKLEEEMTSAKYRKWSLEGSKACRIGLGTFVKTSVNRKLQNMNQSARKSAHKAAQRPFGSPQSSGRRLGPIYIKTY